MLLWRHLAYYLNEDRTDGISSALKSANGFENVRPGQSLRNNFDTRNLRQNAADALSLIFDKLGNLQLVSHSSPSSIVLQRADSLLVFQAPNAIMVDARPHEALIATLLRSLLDLLGEGNST